MNLNDLVGHTATIWILNQGQENLTPGARFEAELKGIDQGAYIFEVRTEDGPVYSALPIGSCRLLFKTGK